MTWTDERVELLKKHHTDGLSCRQIAAELGDVTRNGVIGKLNRLGLAEKFVPSKNPRRQNPNGLPPVRTSEGARAREQRRRLVNRGNGNFDLISEDQPQLGTPIADDLASPIEQRKQFLELQNCHCRWPVGTPGAPDFFFCGGNASLEDRRPYCAAHMKRAHATGSFYLKKLERGGAFTAGLRVMEQEVGA